MGVRSGIEVQSEECKERGASSMESFLSGVAAKLRMVCLVASVSIMTAFFAIALIAMAPIVKLFDPRGHLLHGWAILWARSILFCNPWWKFITSNKHFRAKNGTAVMYVANHQSQTDILAMYIAGIRFRWLAKDAVFKVPLMGWAMHLIGYVPVKRGDKHSHMECMERSRQHLVNGIPMLFFPEGTRSRDGVLQPFKSGAFKLAHEAKVDVIPITIQGSDRLLPKHSLLPRKATVEIVFHEPISAKGRTADALMAEARKAIASALPDNKRGKES